VPLRALGLGAGLLGPTSCPLALLGEVRIKGRIRDGRPVGATQSVPPLSLRPPGTTLGGRTAHSPLPLSEGLRAVGGALEPVSAGRKPPAGTPEI
jgi:hypothetical protein